MPSHIHRVTRWVLMAFKDHPASWLELVSLVWDIGKVRAVLRSLGLGPVQILLSSDSVVAVPSEPEPAWGL